MRCAPVNSLKWIFLARLMPCHCLGKRYRPRVILDVKLRDLIFRRNARVLIEHLKIALDVVAARPSRYSFSNALTGIPSVQQVEQCSSTMDGRRKHGSLIALSQSVVECDG